MIVCIFRSRLRADADREAVAELDRRLETIAHTIPGFLGTRGYTAADGEGVGIIEFASHEALETWRNHPEHVAAKRRGREEFFATVQVQICEVVASSGTAGV